MAAKKDLVYSSDTKEEIKSALKGLTDKPQPKSMSLQALIQSLKTDINAAKKAGYTLDEIVKTLSDNRVEIAANTLKRYLNPPKKSASKPTTESDNSHLNPPKKSASKPTPEGDNSHASKGTLKKSESALSPTLQCHD